MSAQWQRADPAEHDYTAERWNYVLDGYVAVFVHRKTRGLCDHCGRDYAHFFVSHADWAKVPLEHRSKRLCVDCYASLR